MINASSTMKKIKRVERIQKGYAIRFGSPAMIAGITHARRMIESYAGFDHAFQYEMAQRLEDTARAMNIHAASTMTDEQAGILMAQIYFYQAVKYVFDD